MPSVPINDQGLRAVVILSPYSCMISLCTLIATIQYMKKAMRESTELFFLTAHIVDTLRYHVTQHETERRRDGESFVHCIVSVTKSCGRVRFARVSCPRLRFVCVLSCVCRAPPTLAVSVRASYPHLRLGDGSNLGPCPRIRGPFGVRSRG